MRHFWLTGVAIVVTATAAAGPRPDPGLGPADVVRAQLEALRDNNADDAGIAVAYRFASPENRASIGSLAAFAAMIRQRYRDMLNFEQITVLDREQHAGDALVRVLLTQPEGKRSAYVFIMTRRDLPDCAACWLTGGVVRVPPPDDRQRLVSSAAIRDIRWPAGPAPEWPGRSARVPR